MNIAEATSRREKDKWQINQKQEQTKSEIQKRMAPQLKGFGITSMRSTPLAYSRMQPVTLTWRI